MNKVRGVPFVIVLSLCLTLTGCGETGYLTYETSELQREFTEAMQELGNKGPELQFELDSEEADRLMQNTENEAKDNLDNWIGKYVFGESYSEEDSAYMFMDYDIDIYKEKDQYYADVVVNGQMTAINLTANVYGNEEWISLVIAEYNPEHITGLSEMENTVLLSLRNQGGELYTYWGVLEPLSDKLPYSGMYFEKVSEEVIQTENAGEMNRLEDWIGEYTFSEELSAAAQELRNYDITIYEENGQYYADLRITGGDIGIDVKTHIYGNEEWVSLVLSEYNPGHKLGLEEMENGVLLSMRKQGEDIYTYWGGWPVTELLSDNRFVYYDSNQFFEKLYDER